MNLLILLFPVTAAQLLSLDFTPLELQLPKGHDVTGTANISATLLDSDIQYCVHFCSHGAGIVNIVSSYPYMTLHNNTWTSVDFKATGFHLGRARIQFYMTTLETSTNTSTNATITTTQWHHVSECPTNLSHSWIDDIYSIAVHNPRESLNMYLNYVLMGFMAINLAAVGGQVNLNEAVEYVKKPMSLIVAFVCRFGVVPAVGLGFVKAFQVDTTIALGVLTLLCTPSEGASTLLVTLLEGELSLCVVLLVINNFASVAMLPLWTIVFEMRTLASAGNMRIPFKDIFVLFSYMTSSVTMGFVVNQKLPKIYAWIWLYLPSFTIFTLLAVIVADLYQYAYIFQLISAQIFFLSFFVALSGFVLSAGCAYIARLTPGRWLVIVMEIGVRTSFVSCLTTHVTFPDPERDIAKISAVLTALTSLVPVLGAVLVYRFIYKQNSPEYSSQCNSTQDSCADDPVPVSPQVSRQEVIDSQETAI